MTDMIASTSEADILARVIAAEDSGLSAEAARSILDWKFPDADVERMNWLSQKANSGTLRTSEQEELNNYERVGHLIAIAQSQARLALNENSSDS